MTYLRSQSQYGAALGPERKQNVEVICNAFGPNRALAARHEDAIAKMMHKTCSNRPISKKHDAMRLSKHSKEAGSMASRGAIEARQDAMVKRRAAILKMEGEITRFLVAETFIVADSTAGKDLVALWQAGFLERHSRNRGLYYTVSQ